MTIRQILFALFCLVLFPIQPARTEGTDWPQFRGANRDGHAAPANLLRSWGKDGPRELWRRDLGAGFSSVASVGNSLYTLAATPETEDVLCLDATTGQTRWQVPLGKRFKGTFGDGPRSTPAIEGDVVYAVTSDLQLAALATKDGKIHWQHDLQELFGATRPRFGFSPSPLLNGDLLVLEVGGPEKKSLVAFDKKTGETRWTDLDGPAGSASSIFVELGGEPQYVLVRLAGAKLVGLSKDREELWSHPVGQDTICMPLFVPPDRFFCSSAQQGNGGTMIQVNRSQDGGFEVEELWTERRMRNHFNNSVVIGKNLYGFDNATLRCLDATTGKILWSHRGFGKGSLSACGDQLYILGDQGTLALVAADSNKYRELGRVQAMEGRAWTSPTVAGGKLIVRDLDQVVAYDIRDQSSSPVANANTSNQSNSSPRSSMDGESLDLEKILEKYTVARGGIDHWRSINTLEAKGTFAAFSVSAPFTMVRHRTNLYRLDFKIMGEPAIRARDTEGPWWVFHMFGAISPVRVPMKPYEGQLLRESDFEPALIGAKEKGIKVELAGKGDLDGRPTINLTLTFPDESIETWMLDTSTYLEAAVDSTIHDFTQGQAAMAQRTFFSDFREVDGLLLPYRIALEFGARLEEFTVDTVRLGHDIEESFFALPAPAPKDEAVKESE